MDVVSTQRGPVFFRWGGRLEVVGMVYGIFGREVK